MSMKFLKTNIDKMCLTVRRICCAYPKNLTCHPQAAFQSGFEVVHFLYHYQNRLFLRRC